jgi:hypothetical protein
LLYSSILPSYFFFTYQINKAQITKQFCVNKEEPELKCNGKCHLSKQLKKTAQKSGNEEPGTPALKELSPVHWLQSDPFSINWHLPTLELAYYSFTASATDGFPNHVFPPPKAGFFSRA